MPVEAPPGASAEEALDAGPAGFREVLGVRDFRLLWGAQVAAQLGDKFFAFSLLLSIYSLTHLYLSDAALLLAYTIPAVFLSIPAGILADRYDKKTLMIWTNLSRGVMVLGVPALEITGVAEHQVLPLYVITFIFAGVGQLFAPAEAASIPSLVKRRDLAAATSLFTITIIVTIVLSVPLASVAQGLLGLEGPYYFGAGLFAVAAGAIWLIKPKLAAPTLDGGPPIRAPWRSTWTEIQETWTVVRASRILPFAFAMLTLALAIVFTIFALSAGYMQHVLLRSPHDSYILLIPATVGMVVAGTFVSRRASGAGSGPTNVVRGLGLAGLAMVVLGVLPPILDRLRIDGALVPLAITLAVLFGLGLGAVLIPCLVLIQEETEEATRGKIFGGAFLAINLAIAVPLLAAGAIADLVGASDVVGALGLALIITGIVAWRRQWGVAHRGEPPLTVTSA
ncbi:MAG TPA: MFS transporter [Candidatus Dormibacteraeota bacterium]|nr:MFS transporter [Candidatus Dormibacteraeota bacterium]